MPYSNSGASSPTGFNFKPDVEFINCTVTLAAAAVCATGQALCRDVTSIPSTTGADACVLPTATGAGPLMGVYQGATITNSTAAPVTYTIQLQILGWGQVFAGTNASVVRVAVGSNLVITTATLYATVGTYTVNNQIGVATATGAAVNVGTNITGASAGNTALVNAFINPR